MAPRAPSIVLGFVFGAGVFHGGIAQEVFGPLHIVSTGMVSGIEDAWPADIDADGHNDLVFFAPNWGVTGWFQNKGNGTFLPLRIIDSTFTGVEFGAVGDMDNDGLVDPVIVGNDGRLAYVPRIEGATFGPPMVFAEDLGGTIKCVEVVDLEPDGDLDVVAALGSSGPYGSGFWLNDGAGNMSGPTVLLDLPDGRGLGVADLNGDGRIDVLTILGTNVVRSWNIGNGEFLDDEAILQNTTGIRTGGCVEANGDGHPDPLLMMYDGQVKIGLNDGGGDLPFYSTVASGFTELFAWGDADLNADDYSDLYITHFATDEEMHVLLNDGAGAYPAYTLTQPDPDRYAYRWHAGDLDGDGDEDLATAMYGRVGYLANNGTGHFTGWPVFAPVTISGRWIHGADVENDGQMDLLTGAALTGNGNGDAGWYPNDGTPELGPYRPVRMDIPESTAHFAMDADDDGDVDLFVGVTNYLAPWKGFALYRFNGDSFDPPELLPPFGGAPLIAWPAPGDPNGDGLTDVMHASFEPNTMGWYRNEGDGTFSAPTLNAVTWPEQLTNHDMDQDGDLDFVYGGGSFYAELAWLENDGTGSWIGNYHEIIPDGPLCTYYVMEDGDNDGDLDALAAIQLDDQQVLRWYWNTGGGTFAGSTDLGYAMVYGTQLITGIVDGDALPDIIYRLADGGTVWMRNEGGGQFSEPLPIDGVPGGTAYELMDFDGDDDNDLLIMNYNDTGGVAWIEGITDFALPIAAEGDPPRTLSIRPSVFSEYTTVLLPEPSSPNGRLTVCDAQGRTVLSMSTAGQRTVLLRRASLASGLFAVHLVIDGRIVSTGRVVME